MSTSYVKLSLASVAEVVKVEASLADTALTSTVATTLKADTCQVPLNQAAGRLTEQPVEGVHWKKGPSYGQPTSPTSYQSPRDFNVSVGFRF